MGTTKTCSPLKILFALAASMYSDAEEKLVAGIPWPAGTTTRVLAVVSGGLPFVGLRPDGNRVAQETLAALCMQEWAAAEARVAGTIQHLRGCGAHVRGAVRFGHPADETLSAARGRTRTGPFRLGRVAQEVVRYSPCSVLVGQ